MAGTARRLATSALAASSCLPSAASPAAPHHPLEPDLVTGKLSPKEMVVSQEGKKTLLRLSNRVGNIGGGPLEIRPGNTSTDCDGDDDPSNDLPGIQRVYEHAWTPSDGNLGNDVFTPTPIGCVRYHPPHNHWHVASIARYSLFDEATGELSDGNKVGFCLLDSGRIDGQAQAGFYGISGCGNSEKLPTITGISPGFFGLYTSSTPGQRINVTGLEPGRYCLRSTANPGGTILE